MRIFMKKTFPEEIISFREEGKSEFNGKKIFMLHEA